jgi:hypothetical protein
MVICASISLRRRRGGAISSELTTARPVIVVVGSGLSDNMLTELPANVFNALTSLDTLYA